MLPTALQLRVLSLLPPNERALTVRLVNRDAAELFSNASDCTASLSKLLPPHAVPWAVEAGQQHARQLSLRHKLQLMCTAAASGCKVNLQAALDIVRASVFPELLCSQYMGWTYRFTFPDPGEATIKAGHLHLLGWLLRHCPGLLHPHWIMADAAKHLDYAGVQEVWEALKAMPDCMDGSGPTPAPRQWAFDAVAGSRAPDGVAKLQWMLSVEGGTCVLQTSTPEEAARSGDLSRLQWLRGRGLSMDVPHMLHSALREDGSLEVVRWLVDEAGCRLPAAGAGAREWDELKEAAARSSDGVAKLQWLQERGAPPVVDASQAQLCSLIEFAAGDGQAEVVRYLLSVFRQRFGALGVVDGNAAAASGSIPTAACMHQAGCAFTGAAYFFAAQIGDLAMVRWLAEVAGVSAAGQSLHEVVEYDVWPCDTPADSRELLQAVRLMVAVGVDTEDASSLLSSAVMRGDLALVQYLRQEVLVGRWPAGENTVDAAVGSSCEALLEWMAGQPGWLAGTADSPYVGAALYGDLATLRALRRLRVPWGARDSLAHAVEDGCTPPALQWLAEQGAPVGSWADMNRAFAVAMQHKRFRLSYETVEWLRSLVMAVKA